MTTTHTDIDWARIRSNVGEVVHLANSRGWDLPDEYHQSLAIYREAVRVRDEQPAVPVPPTSAAKVSKWIADQATQRVNRTDQTAIAAQLAESVERDYMRAALSQAESYVDLLRTEFDARVAEFKGLITAAPLQLSGSHSEEEFKLHGDLLRCTEGLTNCAAWREVLSRVTGESDDLHHRRLWLIIDPDDDTMLGTVTRLLAQFEDRLPITPAEWHEVASVRLTMAALDQAPGRAQRFAEASYAGGMQRDGGMLDKTIGTARSGSSSPAIKAMVASQ